MTHQATSTPTALRRPASPLVVFAACYLLFGVAALRVVAGISDYSLPKISWHYSDLNGDETVGQVTGLGLVLLALFSFVVAVVYLVLTILDGRGMNWVRIITWVVVGLTVVIARSPSRTADTTQWRGAAGWPGPSCADRTSR